MDRTFGKSLVQSLDVIRVRVGDQMIAITSIILRIVNHNIGSLNATIEMIDHFVCETARGSGLSCHADED